MADAAEHAQAAKPQSAAPEAVFCLFFVLFVRFSRGPCLSLHVGILCLRKAAKAVKAVRESMEAGSFQVARAS